MKLLIVVIGLLLLTVACKLETSSARPNSNANANRAAESADIDSESKSNCSLTSAAAPVLEGLRVGMSADEVLASLPGGKDDPDVKSQLTRPVSPLGVSEFSVRADKLQPKEKFANISHFTFTLLDGHVSSINIGYSGPAYTDVDEFVTKFVKGTNLPPVGQWAVFPGMETQMKTLTCKNFEVRIFAGGEGGKQNYVLLSDLEAKKTLKERRAKAREQATPTPSP